MGSKLEKYKLLDFLKKEIKSTLGKISPNELKANNELAEKTGELKRMLSISELELENGGDNEIY